MGGRHWTAAEDRRALELIRAGVPAGKIAAELRRTVRSVRHRAYRHGIAECRHNGWPAWSAAEIERLREMRAAGVRHAEAAERLGRTVYAVKYRASSAGIARPAPAWRRPWTEQDDAELLRLSAEDLRWQDIGARMGRSAGACAVRWSRRYAHHLEGRPTPAPADPHPRTDPTKVTRVLYGDGDGGILGEFD